MGSGAWNPMRMHSYELKSAEGYSVIRKSSSLYSTSWLSRYCMITSSVTLPELAAKYPAAQICLPQNFLLSSLNSASVFREVLRLRNCTNLITERYGGTDTKMWTWSFEICPFRISTSFARHMRSIHTNFTDELTHSLGNLTV